MNHVPIQHKLLTEGHPKVSDGIESGPRGRPSSIGLIACEWYELLQYVASLQQGDVGGVDLRVLHLLLIGPNIASCAQQELQDEDATAGVVFRVSRHSELLHEMQSSELGQPDLVVCFNAGLWGYDTWPPTIAMVLGELRCPMV
eukprot:1563644-Amphidinium_carterae.2